MRDTTLRTLGPEGTFSDQACEQLMPEVTTRLYGKTFIEVLANPTSQEWKAVVPIENSVAGTVSQVQDLLVQQQLSIEAETTLEIQYALLSHQPLHDVTCCYAHPQALEQCSAFVTSKLPQATVQFTPSNIASGVQFHENPQSAAIVPLPYATQYPEVCVAEQIQDYAKNVTRFLLVKPRKPDTSFDFSKQKTSLYIEPTTDHPGLLYELLRICQQFELNFCRLESRPSKTTPWQYVFFADFYNTPQTENCLNALQEADSQFTVLGSYDLR